MRLNVVAEKGGYSWQSDKLYDLRAASPALERTAQVQRLMDDIDRAT